MKNKIIDCGQGDSESLRDKRGRFMSGTSGNPMGRPRKQPTRPWSIQEALRAAFSEEVDVGGGTLPKRTMPLRDVCIHKLVRGVTQAGAKDQVFMLERLLKLGVFDMPDRDPWEDDFTEADRQLIKDIERDLDLYCKCGGVKDNRPHSER